jgi:TorA maturation chaperone TorD
VNRDLRELRILAALLAQPEDDALDALRDLLTQAPWLAVGVAELERTPLEHWQAEHTRLFINGWPRTPCPPFESAYRQGEMGGTSVGDLGDLYRRAGLQATEAPPDYLGTLLECAAWLAGQPDGGPLLQELEEAHIDRWVPRFAQDLRANAGLILYRTLGERLAALFPADDALG